MFRVLCRIAKQEFARPDERLARHPLIRRGAWPRWPRQPPDAGLRDVVGKPKMLVAFLAPRPHRAGLRIANFHRHRETLAQRTLVDGGEIPVGAGQEKHAVDTVGSEIVQPLADGRIVEPRDRAGPAAPLSKSGSSFGRRAPSNCFSPSQVKPRFSPSQGPAPLQLTRSNDDGCARPILINHRLHPRSRLANSPPANELLPKVQLPDSGT